MSSKKPAPSDASAKGGHKDAAGAYQQRMRREPPANQRALEAKALLKAAKLLNDVQAAWTDKTPKTLEENLKFNRQLWAMFYDSALNNDPPRKGDLLRSNVLSLANFVFTRSLDILAEPEKHKLDILININREIAAGLMTDPAKAEAS